MENETLKIYEQWKLLESQRNELKQHISQKFMLEFNYNSNHIEGNTLTYGQTELLLLFGKIIGNAKMKDLEEMKAHNIGLQIIKEEALLKQRILTETFIRQLHTILLREDYEVYRQLPNGLQTSYTVHAGTYKTRPNSVITRTGERFEYASPEETPALMNDLMSWYNSSAEKGELNPIELAALFHYRYIRIHPFEDGNGRIARLIVNFILCRYGYPMIVVPSKTKEEYLLALNLSDLNVGLIPSDGAHASLEQIQPFITYMEKLVRIEMLNDITIVKGEKDSQWWYDGEIVKFSNGNIKAIINAISKNPAITVRGLAGEIGINTSAIQRHLKYLQEKYYLVRMGNNKKGEWHIALSKL
jgi:Fic family protein